LVGVEPQTVELNGQDPAAYILSANINRRHMTKSQRAMAVAMVFPEPQKLKRKGTGSSKNEELASGYVSSARRPWRWCFRNRRS
jgi:hypothetical protein